MVAISSIAPTQATIADAGTASPASFSLYKLTLPRRTAERARSRAAVKPSAAAANSPTARVCGDCRNSNNPSNRSDARRRPRRGVPHRARRAARILRIDTAVARIAADRRAQRPNANPESAPTRPHRQNRAASTVASAHDAVVSPVDRFARTNVAMRSTRGKQIRRRRRPPSLAPRLRGECSRCTAVRRRRRS